MSLPGGEVPRTATLRFYVTERRPPRPAAIVLAVLAAASVLTAVSFGLGHSKHRHFGSSQGQSASREPGGSSGSGSQAGDDKDDDPSQIDTVVLGDAGDAPRPARLRGRVTDVHATVVIHLPRYGENAGLIPDTPSGHLLYGWLAAFNKPDLHGLEQLLPNAAASGAADAQIALRIQNGGFNLLSAREVQPDVLVFRLRDQTPEGTEVLGTIQMRKDSRPPAIASLSLRAVAQPAQASASAPKT